MSRPYTLYCRNQLLVLTQNSKQDHYYTRHILDFPISFLYLYTGLLFKRNSMQSKKYGTNNPALSFLITILKWILILIYILFDLVFLYDYQISLEYYILKFHIFIFFPDTNWFTLDSIKMVSRLNTQQRKFTFWRGRGGGYNYLKVCNCYITGRKARRRL